MDSLAQISPAVLKDYILSSELPVRTKGYGSKKAVEIFRFGGFVGSEIRVYPSLGRAMDQARTLIGQIENRGKSVRDGSLILASTLSGGKGRFQRHWHAPMGGLWGCLILSDSFLPIFRNILPLIPGIACCEALHQEGVEQSAIRWVNDVLVDGKKQAGFLLEGYVSPVHHDQYHLLGFGLNVNNCCFPQELEESATSLALLLGEPIDLGDFALSFLAKMSWYVGLLFHEEKEWLGRSGMGAYDEEHPILSRWLELSDTIGKWVQFGYDVIANPQYEALVQGVSRDGGLVLRHDDGSVSVEHSGEVRYQG